MVKKVEFHDPEADTQELPPTPEPEKPEGQDEVVLEGKTVKVFIPDAHGYTDVIKLTHPDYLHGEKSIYIKRNEPVEIDERILEQLDQPYFDEYVQDTDERGEPIGKMKKVRKKLFPYHIVS